MLEDYEKYKILRPLFDEHEYTKDEFPIIRKDYFELDELESLEVVNLKNLCRIENKLNSLLLMFNDEVVLNRLWNDPFRYLAKFTGFLGICTPDFSIYPGMNINDIKFNVYRSRWYGCMLQEKGYKVVPTIQWGDERTYDFCFSGVEEGSIVIVSTLGCQKNQGVFLKGFNEMKRIIKPEIILVFGKMIPGMTGNFIHFDYKDSFMKKKHGYEQLSLFPVKKIFTIESEED